MLTPSSLSSETRSHASEFSRSSDELPDAESAELKDTNDALGPSEIGGALEEQIRQATGVTISSLELTTEALEERVAPTAVAAIQGIK